ncbi:MAG: outer membrane lipoprotein carrier protein LolA [Gemmatimonadaceae bacterium]
MRDTLGLRFAAVAALAFAVRPLHAQSVSETIDRAVAAWSAAKTIRATFEQTLKNPLTGSDVTARGEFQQQGRNRIDIRFTDPAGDRIVADGRSLWIYLPSTTPGQVIRSSLGKGANSVDLAGQLLTSPKSKYRISAAGTATVGGRPAHGLVLVPKREGEQPFTRATVWVDDRDGLIRQFEVTDQSGVMRRVRLTAIRVNAPVDPAAFRFTPPEGIRVVEQ